MKPHYVPTRPKQYNVKITPSFEVCIEANKVTTETATVSGPHSTRIAWLSEYPINPLLLNHKIQILRLENCQTVRQLSTVVGIDGFRERLYDICELEIGGEL